MTPKQDSIITRLATTLRATTARFRKRDDGVAAVEFAFLSTIMVTMLIGIVDISNAVSLNWRMTQLNRTLADLSSQMRQVSNAEMANVFAASAATLRPLNGSAPRMVVSSVVIDGAGVARVCWSEGSNAPALARGTIVTLPSPALAIPNTSLMVTRTDLTFNAVIMPDFGMSSRAMYFRPRQGVRGGANNVEQVERVGVAMC